MEPISDSSGEKQSVTFALPGRYAHLGAIREAVLHAAALAGFSIEKSAQLEMAVDEACSNIIEHSYGGETAALDKAGDEGIRLDILRSPGRLDIDICDRGNGFDFDNTPAVQPTDYFDERRQRGLGMYIIRCFVDAAAYQRATPRGNCLRLTKFA